MWAEAAVDSFASGVLVCGDDGRVRFASRAARKILGLAEDELLGRRESDLFGVDSALRERVAWLPHGEESDVRVPIVVPGLEHGVRVTFAPLDLPREPGSFVLAFRPEAPEAAHESRPTPDDWSRALSTVVAGFAHATRNPLAAIHGLVDLWSDGADADDPDHEIVERVRLQVQRMVDLLRSFSALDLTHTPDPRPHPVAELLAATRARLAAARRDDLVLGDVPFDPAAERVAVDLDNGAAVLAELWQNALEAQPSKRPPELRLRTSARSGGSADEVHFEVFDSGPGVPPRQLARVFEPFYTTKGHRLGIGLTIARVHASRMGGRVAVRSTPKYETVFSLILPGAPR